MSPNNIAGYNGEVVEAVVHTESGPIALSELAEFFQLFRMAYAAAGEFISLPYLQQYPDVDAVQRIADQTQDHLAELSESDIDIMASRPLELEPSILKIHRDNPLEIIFGGLVVLFGVAVVISGGKMEISPKGIKVSLPPLGEGIKKLRESLKRSVWTDRRAYRGDPYRGDPPRGLEA